MNFKGILIVTLFFGLLACGNKSGNNATNEESTTMETDAPRTTRQAPQPMFTKMFDAGDFTFTVQSKNGERSQVKLATKGLENEYAESMEIEGQVLEGYMLDINGDGKKEFILTILPTDDSGNIDIMAFTSLGNSLINMYVQEPTLLRQMRTDKVEVKNNQVIRTFKADGQMHRFTYEMVPGENGINLVAKKE